MLVTRWIPSHIERVPLWRTQGVYRKEMKRRYSKKRYHQRSKDETVFSVVKRTVGDEVRSMGVKAQNNETRAKIISYNAARIASLAYSLARVRAESEGFQFSLKRLDCLRLTREQNHEERVGRERLPRFFHRLPEVVADLLDYDAQSSRSSFRRA